jgi:hypothetical protein
MRVLGFVVIRKHLPTWSVKRDQAEAFQADSGVLMMRYGVSTSPGYIRMGAYSNGHN